MLVLKNNIIYVHIPKTGGRCVNNIFRKLDMIDGEYPFHSSVNDLSDEHVNYEKVATIRNPWEWYVSLWAFKKRKNRQFPKKGIKKRRYMDANSDFPTYLKRMFDDEYTSQFNNIVHLVGGKKIDLNEMKEQDIGAYTNVFKDQCYTDGKDNVTRYIKLEKFHTDFQKAFKLTDEQVKSIDLSRRIGMSDHNHYKSYYTDELVDLVNHKERLIIEKFDYSF